MNSASRTDGRGGTPNMNPRQQHALLNPYTDPHTQNPAKYRHTEPQPDGNILVTILAVDR